MKNRPTKASKRAWSEEIKRRIEEIDSGKVRMIPFEEVRRLAARLTAAEK
jgi:hypothetical protein